MLVTMLLVLLVVSLVGGGVGQSRFGYASWSPVGVIVLLLVVLFFTGHLHT